LRRQGCEPSHSRPWRRHGPAGRILGCGGRRLPDRPRPPGLKQRGAGSADMVNVTQAPGVVGEEPAARMRSISILGATGSIGASTVDLIRRNRGRYRVETVAAGRNAPALAKVAREVGAAVAVVSDEKAYADLKDALAG